MYQGSEPDATSPGVCPKCNATPPLAHSYEYKHEECGWSKFPEPTDDDLREIGEQFAKEYDELLGTKIDDPEPWGSSRGLDDWGNAERLAIYEGHRLRYVKEDDQWRIYEQGRWRVATRGDMVAVTLAAIKKMGGEIRLCSDQAQMSDHAAWLHRSLSDRAIKAAASLAVGIHQLWIKRDAFDNDPYLVNFTNGTYDVRTGELLPHDPKHMLTRIIPYDLDLDATCDEYTRLVSHVFHVDDLETWRFAVKTLGYSALLGSNPEQRIFFLVGDPNSGKTKALEVVKRVLGSDYAHKSKPDLIARKREHHDSEKLSLLGKRFVTLSETSAMFNLDEQTVKEITGDFEVTTRMLYSKEERNTRVTWKIWLAVNDFPNVLEWDDAIKRRVVPIPSGAAIPVDRQDMNIADRIVENETLGVLALLIRGVRMWYDDWQTSMETEGAQRTGLAFPPGVAEFLQRYADSQDVHSAFIRESVDLVADGRTRKSDVHNAFKRWRGLGEKSGRNKLYARVLELPGVYADEHFFYGIRLVEPSWSELRSRAGDI